jgi:hypothetical protein
MAAGSVPSDRTCIIHLRTDERLIELHTAADRQTAAPVKEGPKHAQSLSYLLSHLADVCRPGCIKGHLKIASGFDLLYWLSEKVHWPGQCDAPRGHGKEHSDAFLGFDSDRPVSKPELQFTAVGLQMTNESEPRVGYRW